MADNSVAYKIVVDTSKAVQEIKILEEEIARLKKELSTSEGGTLGFQTLEAAIEGLQKKYDSLIQTAISSGDIITQSATETTDALDSVAEGADKADTSLKGLGETSKKIDVSTPFKNYVKIGSAVTASFAAAQSVFAVFGADSTKIAEAAAKAQALLTVAIAAREAAEAVGASTTLKATIATELKTAADNTQIAVLKRLYTVLANNPYAVVAAGVGLLVTAFIALTQRTEKVRLGIDALKVKQDELNTITEQSIKIRDEELKKVVPLINLTEKENISKSNRNKAIRAIQEVYPDYLKNQNLEKISIEDIKKANDDLTESIQKRARSSAALNELTRIFTEELKLQQLAEERAIARQKRLDDARASGRQDFVQGTIETNKSLEAIDKADRERTQKQLDIQKRVALSFIDEADALNDATNALLGNTDAKDNNNKATEEQVVLAKQLEDALNNQLTTLEDTAEVFKKLAEAGGFQIAEPEVLQRVKELKNNIQGLIPPDLKDKFKNIGLDIVIENGTYAIKEFGNELNNIEDVFGFLVEAFRKELSAGVFTKTIDEFGKITSGLIKRTSELLQQGLITTEAFESAEKLIQQYKDLNRVVTELPEGVKQVFTEGRIQEYLDITKNIALATGQIQYERVNGEIVKVKNTTIDLAKETERLNNFQKSSVQSLIDLYTEQFQINLEDKELSREKFVQEINNLEKLGKLTADDAAKLRARVQDTNADFKKLVKEVAEAQVAALNNTVQNIISEESQVREFLFKIQQERTEALELQTEAEQRLLLNNLEDVFKITQSQNKIVIDETKTREEQLASLLKQFSDKKIDLSKLTEEERLKILQFYLDKQIEAENDANKKRTEAADKFIESISQIQGALNSLGQTTSAYFNNQFDILENRYKRITEGIIGDSQEAAQKRIDAEKSYQEERKKLEKQAAKTSLRIALAQSLASTAEAIAKTYAVYGGTPIAVGAAAAVAAFSAAQTLIIANQLANIDSYRKGGRIKLQGGGLVQGPSHEYGGVKFQGGGIELEGNEAVINRVSTVNYMGLLSQINQSGGGKPIGNFDDSRIVEAIAKQRNTPIRAYVVESDITAKQTTARRFEELASF